ncbi:hypothetical protein BC937DRAFT_90267 [Endogone sp. FLAS-F59071]|nr:hypothetical protein BC937DRAFT_90267 [Endogone sp. FLAS-F59071]|eukprot:RUS17209.1 hypothetical protein BC937DRAFT_90267 [Endogone sp. FLAS-F59071]
MSKLPGTFRTCLRNCRVLYPSTINGGNLLYTSLWQRSAFTSNPPQLLRQLVFSRHQSGIAPHIPALRPAKPPKFAKPAKPSKTATLYKVLKDALQRHDITTAWTQFDYLRKVYPTVFDFDNTLIFARLLHTLKLSSLTDRIAKALVVCGFMNERNIKIESMHRAHLISIYISEGQPNAALAIFEEARQAGKAISRSEYTQILQYLVANGMVAHATEIYKHLLNCNLLLTTKDQNFLLVELLKAGMLTEAEHLASEMKKLEIVVDSFSYTTFIETYFKEGQLNEAVALFENMPAHGVERTTFTYMAMINGYVRHDQVEKAIALFESMVGGPEPDAYLYTNMIDVYSNHGQLDAAVALFKSMSVNKVKPTTATYTAMIGAYAKHERLDDAVALFNSMHANGAGVEPKTRTYTTMIDAYAKSGRLNEAINLFEAMDNSKVLRDEYTYKVMTDAYRKRGMMEKAIALAELMEARGFSLDAIMYVTIFDAYTKLGKLVEAEKYLKQGLDQFGVEALFSWPGFSIMLMNYHNRSGHHEDVVDVWEKLIIRTKHQRTRQLQTGLSVLLDSAGRNTDFETVISTWSKAISIEDFQPNTNNYTSFVEALCHCDATDEAIKVLTDLMPVAKVRQDYKTITTLLAHLLRKEKFDDYKRACKALEPLHRDLFESWNWQNKNLPTVAALKRWGVTSIDIN